MVIDFTLLGTPFYVDQPQELIGWVGWFILLSILILLLFQWKRLNKHWARLQGGIFVGLLVLLLLTNLFLVIRLTALETFTIQGQTITLGDFTIPVLAALPWVLAAGLLGVFPAVGMGLLSGALIALLSTHSLFTVLEYGLLAAFLGAAFHQRYRTWVFRALRHPLFATALFSLVYPFLFLLDATLVAQGSLAARLDYALSQVGISSITVAIQLLAAGLISEVVALVFPRLWGFSGPLEPSPVEQRLQSRFFSSLALLAIVVIVGLMAGDWIVAGRAATGMLNDRLESTAKIAANNVPAFLETGQNLIQILAKDPAWTQGTLSEKNILLGDILRTIPYFSEYYLLDANGRPNRYPVKIL
jgi:hypothetical protein